jgi:RNA polymerase sigma-70 factor (ECF subfamily)
VKDPEAQLIERLLILRCQAGGEDALRELITRYSPGLRLFLKKMTASATTADDLLQETWFDVFRSINALKRPEAFSAWLYRIARNKAYRELRRRPPPVVVEVNLEELPSVEEQSFTVEEAEYVREALDELPVEQREVLVLRFVEGMSYEQIANVIASPLGTVRSRIHYAKRALKEKLKLITLKKEMRP